MKERLMFRTSYIRRGRELHNQMAGDLDNMTPYPRETIKSHIFPKAIINHDESIMDANEDLNKSSLILGFKIPKKIKGGRFGKA